MQRFESARRLQILTIDRFMDAFGWINFVLLVIVLIGYAYHKGTYNPFKALWDDITKSNKASSKPH
ncbi:MAG: hypothetical protein U1E51_08595 [Candidatus Binatia bacterium]|nr:hypothetical protein [Candidatus Binatia bacterium]